MTLPFLRLLAPYLSTIAVRLNYETRVYVPADIVRFYQFAVVDVDVANGVDAA